MSKFCNNCGNMVDDDAVFCTNCGATFEAAPVPEEAPQAPRKAKKPLNKKMIGMIVGVVAVVILAIVVISMIGGGSKSQFNGVISDMEAITNGDFDDILDIAPEAYWEYLEDQDKDFDREDLAKDMEKDFKSESKNYKKEFGDDWKISLSVVDEKQLDDDMIEDAAAYLDEKYGIDEESVTNAYTVWVRMDIKGEDGFDHAIQECTAIKIDGTWYPCEIWETENYEGDTEIRVDFMD